MRLILEFLFNAMLMCLGECQQKSLLDHLFSNYRKELRPVRQDKSGPTNVTVQLYFKQIQKVQESDQILTLYCWLEEVNFHFEKRRTLVEKTGWILIGYRLY